ncbi:MAG TPA: zinc ribbon domain-containing protein [Streptosporangiaceae bacterium]
MKGSRRFCVQCGHELKPDLRFCVACGHSVSGADPAQAGGEQVTAAGGYEATPTMTAFAREDVAPAPPSAEPAWPSKGSYQPTEVSTRPPTEVSARPPLSSPPAPPDGLRRPVDQPAPPLDGFARPVGQPLSAPDDFSRPTASPVPAPEGGPGYQRPVAEPPPGWPPRDPRSGRPGGGPRPRPPARGRRSRRPLVGLLAVLLPAVVAAAVAFFLLGPSHAAGPSASTTQTSAGNQATAQASTASPSVSTSPSPSATLVSEQQAASNLAALLSQSVKDRSSITAAVNDVNSCGPTLSQDPQTFQHAATSRQQLLTQLAGLSGRSALPAAMLQSLTSAWQASVAADKDLGKWAQDEISKGCTPNDEADANFQAAIGPDGQATTDKKAFVGQWNSIASQYGLTKYQWNQL